MVKGVHQERKEEKDWMALQALGDPKDPREKWVILAPQAHQPTPPTLLWLKVAEVTQDFQGSMGSQEPGVHQENPAHQAFQAPPSEMKKGQEAFRVKWDPKAS